MVPCPGVIDRSLIETDPISVQLHPCPFTDLGDVSLRFVNVAGDDHQRFKIEYIAGNVHIALKDTVYLIPLGIPVGPCELYTALSFPFCRQSPHTLCLYLSCCQSENEANRYGQPLPKSFTAKIIVKHIAAAVQIYALLNPI